jgi:hypothetical protein
VYYTNEEFLALTSRHGTPITASGFRTLADTLEQERLRPYLEEKARREALTAPFAREIEVIAAKFRAEPVKLHYLSMREKMTWFLEDYVVKHGRMPRGRTDVEFVPWWSSTRFSIGIYDFDDITCLPS